MKNIDLNTLYDDYHWNEEGFSEHYFFNHDYKKRLSDDDLEHMYLQAQTAIPHFDYLYYDDGREIKDVFNPFPRIPMKELVLYAVCKELTSWSCDYKLYFRSVNTKHFYEMYQYYYEGDDGFEYYRIKSPFPFATRLSALETKLEPTAVAFGKEIYTAKRRKYIISTI